MKKLFITFILSITYALSLNAQKTSEFVFVKSTILKLEKYATFSDDDIVKTNELKKRMQGMFLIENQSSEINYESNEYIKFSSIPTTDRFVMVTDGDYDYYNSEKNLIIQNIKTKKTYAVMAYAMRTYQDYSNMSNEANGNGWLTKVVPKELTQSEKDLVIRYKALINSANSNIIILQSIQKKYLTRGYFDSERVSLIDKQTYNKNIEALKIKAEKLADIDRYEDKDDKAQGKLTTAELGMLNNINDWNINQVKL